MTASMARRVTAGGDTYWRCSCGRSFDVKQWADDHMDQAHRGGRAPSQAAHLSQLKAEMERAIWEARREGYGAALEDLLNLLSMDAGGGRDWTVEEAAGFVQQRMDDNRDERVEKPWLRA